MQRAAELLAETSIPVGDIAARVGYRQPAQFAKAFARVHGVPPTRYRADCDRRFAAAA
jgi:AraC family transcriptional regulator of adaptative response / methylphosphotriester-DNA alkyltransferase methyltransferase